MRYEPVSQLSVYVVMVWSMVNYAMHFMQHSETLCTMNSKLELNLNTQFDVNKKGKAAPLQAWTGQEGSRKLRLPDFVTTAQDGGKVVSLTHRPLFTPRKYSWYSFLLETESTPGPQCDRRDKKF